MVNLLQISFLELNLPYGFEIYLVNVKTMRTIAQIFAAFSENLNFNFSVNFELCAHFMQLKFILIWCNSNCTKIVQHSILLQSEVL